ncbi:MAG TPA: glycosyltransferase family protein [Polyangiaceae bacterium]
MRILYGVVGEGMGHATRSRVVLEHLLRAGHTVRVVVSGRAHKFLVERLAEYRNAKVEEIHGLTLTYLGNRLAKSESLASNLRKAPKGIRKNIEVYRKVAEDGFQPELVISDFETWAALYALSHFLPVVSIDNMQIINRCAHVADVVGKRGFAARATEWAVKIKLPGAYHYLISSFFFPKVRKKRTTLLPPILRPEIVSAAREPGKHVLVYQTASSNAQLIPTLQKLPYEFRVYGMDREGSEGNVTLCPFSETRFVDDLRTARAAIAGGGFSFLSEAVSLQVPLLSIPVEEQFEQELNARYLAHLKYGAWSRSLDEATVVGFLEKVDEYASSLSAYQRYDNAMLFGCVDELLQRAARGEKRPVTLDSPALGKWQGG